MPVSTPKYKNLFCQTLKKQVLIRGFLLYRKFRFKTNEAVKKAKSTSIKNVLTTTKEIVLVSGKPWMK